MVDDTAEHASDEADTPLEQIVSGAVTVVTFVVGFGLLAAGVGYFWVAFVVGFAGLLPMALGLARYYERQREPERTVTVESQTETALEELRERYARGEFSDEEFERRVERLLETDSVAEARQYAERTDDGTLPADRDRDRKREREF